MVKNQFIIPKNSLETWPKPKLTNNTKDSNSWFDIKGISLNDDITHVPNKTLIRCDIIKLSLKLKQSNIVNKWLEAYRLIYNHALKYVKENGLLSFYQLRAVINKKEEVIKIKERSNIPGMSAQNAIHDVVKAYTSAIALSKTTKRKFRIRYKKLNSVQNMALDFRTFSTRYNSFQTSMMGNKIKSSKDFMLKDKDNNYIPINHDCRLVHKRNQYLLYIPRDKETFTVESKVSISLDPGLRTFQTCYQENGNIIEYGNNVTQKITKYLNRLDKMVQLENYHHKKFQKRINDKIHNLVNDLHWKCAKDIVTKSDTVFIGKLNTKSIVSNKSNLSKLNKRICYALSHYTFRMRLKAKCEQYNVRFIEVNESYTSITCGSCGKLNKELKESKIFRCPSCPFVTGRDHNGARNIMIKGNL